MSKKSLILTSSDIPDYIKEIVKRLYPVLVKFEDKEGNWWGYTFKLDAKWKCGYESQLKSDCEKLIKWCNGKHAYSTLIRHAWWYDSIEPPRGGCFGDRHHKRKALKEGWRNHSFLVISDPVAKLFEENTFFRNERT